MNLNRAALAWLADPATAIPTRDVDFEAILNNPWRDPFTAEMFLLDSLTSPTMIYSPGPDLTDDRGAVQYDPTNGTISPGDLSIRLRPPIEKNNLH